MTEWTQPEPSKNTKELFFNNFALFCTLEEQKQIIQILQRADKERIQYAIKRQKELGIF